MFSYPQSKCNKLESSQEKLECLFTEMAAMNEALQEQLDEATEKCHAMEVCTPSL